MYLRVFLLISLFLSLFLELSLVSFPLTFLFTAVIFSVSSQFRYLIPAAILSLISDFLLLHSPGVTVIAVVIIMLLIRGYAYYFGSKDLVVYVLFILVGIFSYAMLLGYSVPDLIRWLFFIGLIWIIYRLLPKNLSL